MQAYLSYALTLFTTGEYTFHTTTKTCTLTKINMWVSLPMSIIQINIIHSLQRNRPKGLMFTVAWNYPYFVGTIRFLLRSRWLVKKDFAIMLKMFRENPIEVQVREFKGSKYGMSSHIMHIEDYKKFSKLKCVSEMTYESVQSFRNYKNRTTSPYTTISSMIALRSFIRYHKRLTDLKPQNVTNEGVLIPVVQSVTIKPMKQKIEKVRFGRPRDEESIKKVRLLKEKGGLTFRAISTAMNKDVKTIYRWYRVAIEDNLLSK